MKLAEMTNEELVYHLGGMEKMKLKSAEVEDEMAEVVAEMKERGVLLECDSKGNGWRVLSETGETGQPPGAKDTVFSEKGYAFLYWLSSGREYGAKLTCVSDPIAEEAAISDGERVEVDEVFVVGHPPNLEVVPN